MLRVLVLMTAGKDREILFSFDTKGAWSTRVVGEISICLIRRRFV